MTALVESISPSDSYVHLHKCMGSRLMWAVINMEYNSDNFHSFDWRRFDPWSMEWANDYETPYKENN